LTAAGIFDSPPNMSMMAFLKSLRASLFAALSSAERNQLKKPRTESVVEAVIVRPAS